MARKRKKLSNIILYVLIAILGLGLIGVSAKLNDTLSTDKVSATSFVKGTIGDDGLLSTDGECYSAVSPFVNVDGLKIEINEDDIKYKLYYFTEDKGLIESSAFLTEDFDASSNSIPSNAKYVRVAVYLVDNSPMTILMASYYGSHLTITYNK